MLSAAENELVTSVGPGTPMGEVFRRLWLPVLTSADLGEPDSAPVRLRLLGEDLVGFRDTTGAVGVIQAACPHRRAKLFWGRNEECGLRCAYHGWKFDVAGQCVDTPSEPAESRFKERIRAKSYPAVERGGLVWLYMGPEADEPPFPHYSWLDLPAEEVQVTSWLQRSNWLQSLEGDLDSAHVSFLHSWLDPDAGPPAFISGYRRYIEVDKSPRLTVQDTPYGFIYGGRRTIGDGEYYWRATQWLAPAGSQVGGGEGMRFLTPIDDGHSVSFSVQRVAPGAVRAENPPLVGYALPDGYIVDVQVPEKGPENDFLIDREVQRTTTFTGISGGARDQDRAMTETMEPVLDRTDEHLGTTDLAIVAVRRRLVEMARDLQRGIAPAVAQDGEIVHGASGFNVLSRHAEFADVVAEVREQGSAASRGDRSAALA
jgi:phthalate 4,5-dioxygenase